MEKDYTQVYAFSENSAWVTLNGKQGFINNVGKDVVPIKYDDSSSFSEGLATVRTGEAHTGKWGFIDKTGKEVIVPKYDFVGDFSEGMAEVSLNGKWGYIDRTGREAIALKYDDAGYFSEGLAPIELGGKYGFIDKTGKAVIAPKYDWADHFSQGISIVELNGKWGIMKNPFTKGFQKMQAQSANDVMSKSSAIGQNNAATGSDLKKGDGKSKSAVLSNAKMELGGKEVNLTAYTINGNNYFKLRDICEVLGVEIGRDQVTQTILLKTK